MMLQEEIDFDEYFRCYVLGRKHVRIMQYDPRQPLHERYVQDAPADRAGAARRASARRLPEARPSALGYDFNTVEFAVRDGIPYAIDFMNPAPDADVALGRRGELRVDRRARPRWLIERSRRAPSRSRSCTGGDLAGSAEAVPATRRPRLRRPRPGDAPPRPRGDADRMIANGPPSPSASRRSSRSSIRRRASCARTSRSSSTRASAS